MFEQLKIEGIDVFVEGDGAETIVMIHGWPDTYRLWDDQVAFLNTQYRCVRFTLPGFDIDQPRRATSLAQTVELFRKIIQQVSPDQKVILMLHDWGCLFGYQFTMQHQSMVSKIIGVDIGDASAPAYIRSLSAKAKAMIFAYQMWLAIAWRCGGRLGDWMTKRMARTLLAFGDQRYIGAGMNYPYYIQWTGTYGSYKHAVTFLPPCPMLFIYGKKKPFMFHSPQWIDTIAGLPGGRVVALDTAHWVMAEQPQAFNRTVNEWLSEKP